MTVSTDQETLSHLSLEALQKQLTTSNQGLSKKEALQRQSKGGYNELPETTVSPIKQLGLKGDILDASLLGRFA